MKKFLSLFLSLLILLTLCVPAFASESAEEKTSYLLLGDSIAAAHGLDNPDKGGYGAIVAYSNGYDYKNDAISGSTSDACLKLLQTSEPVKTDIEEADIISLSIGGNDFILDNIVKLIIEAKQGNYSNFEKIADKYYNNLSKIYDTIKQYNPQVVILVQNLYNPMTGSLREIYQNGINILNSRIEKFASLADDMYLVDVAAYTKDLGEEYFQNDHVHPSAEGHAVIAQAVVDTLYSLGLGTAQTAVAEEPGITHKGFLTAVKKIIKFFKDFFDKLQEIFGKC